MKRTRDLQFFRVLFLCILFLLIGCDSENEVSDKVVTLNWDTYANAYGEIKVAAVNDSVYRTVFTNNEGVVFDTLMQADYHFRIVEKRDSLPFLQFNTGGIELGRDLLYVHEFAGFAELQYLTKINYLYKDPFFCLNKEIELIGPLIGDKGGKMINGVYLPLMKIKAGAVYKVIGEVIKEPFPIAYYATDESPQGIFGSDTTKVHYRMIFKTCEVIPYLNMGLSIFSGKCVNSNGRGGLALDFADSGVLFLVGKMDEWSASELGDSVVYKGGRFGDTLYDWELVEQE